MNGNQICADIQYIKLLSIYVASPGVQVMQFFVKKNIFSSFRILIYPNIHVSTSKYLRKYRPIVWVISHFIKLFPNPSERSFQKVDGSD